MIEYHILFGAVIIFDYLLAFGSFKVKNRNGFNMGIIMSAAMGITAAYLCSISVGDYFLSAVFDSFVFIGIDILLIFLLRFVLDFTNMSRKGPINQTQNYLIGIFLMLDSLLLLLNPVFEIVTTYEEKRYGDIVIYQFVSKPGFMFHFAYCYLLLGLSVAALVYKYIHTPSIYKKRYVRLIEIILSMVLLDVIYHFRKDWFMVDFSICLYSLCSMLIYNNVFHNIEQEMLMQTREMLMDYLGRGIAIFDYENRLIDCNKEMARLFPELDGSHSCDMNLEKLSTGRSMPELYSEEAVFEWRRYLRGEEHVYKCEFSTLKDQKDLPFGKILMMRDVTYTKDVVTGLDHTEGLDRYLTEVNFPQEYPTQILVVNVNGLSIINRALGHDKGNEVMKKTVEIMKKVLPEDCYMARREDGSIVAVLLRTSHIQGRKYVDRIMAKSKIIPPMNFEFELEYGMGEVNKENADAFTVLKEALESMKNRKLLSESSESNSLMQSLSQTLLESDYETEEHVMRTKKAAVELGNSMHLSEIEISKLALLSVLHDIGKIAIPHNILLKPGKLDDEEWKIMKTHTEKGYRIARASKELEPVADLILHHHERWDGFGYPGKLKGEEIPLLSRIITVIDSYDVMIHDRPYHKAISVQSAKEELRRCSGSQFDPEIVEAYLRLLDTSAKQDEKAVRSKAQ